MIISQKQKTTGSPATTVLSRRRDRAPGKTETTGSPATAVFSRQQDRALASRGERPGPHERPHDPRLSRTDLNRAVANLTVDWSHFGSKIRRSGDSDRPWSFLSLSAIKDSLTTGITALESGTAVSSPGNKVTNSHIARLRAVLQSHTVSTHHLNCNCREGACFLAPWPIIAASGKLRHNHTPALKGCTLPDQGSKLCSSQSPQLAQLCCPWQHPILSGHPAKVPHSRRRDGPDGVLGGCEGTTHQLPR